MIGEDTRFWIADLGTLDITKAGNQKSNQTELVLEGKKARVFFSESGMALANLNELVLAPELMDDLQAKMNLVVSDLEFAIDLFKTEVKKEEGAVDLVDNLNFTIHPFKINLFDSALRSLFTLALKLSQETKREKAFIDRILKRGDILATSMEIEYDIGYEVWEECDVVLEGQVLHVISRGYNLLASQDLSKISSMGLEGSEEFWRFSLASQRKRLSLRSTSRDLLSQLKFKIQSVLSLIENRESSEPSSKVFTTDYIVSLQFTEIILVVQNYSKDVSPFEFSLRGLSYSSEYLDGVENGNLQFIECLVSDPSDKFPIFNFESGRDIAMPGLVYNYTYQKGVVDSSIKLCNIELAYKVEYVQSLMKLIEIIIEYLVEGKKTRSDASPKRKMSQEAIILDDPIIRKNNTKQNLSLTCNSTKIDVYFKKNIKSVTLTASQLHMNMTAQGLNKTVITSMKKILLVSHLEYPYRKNSPTLAVPFPLVYLEERGGIQLTFRTKESDKWKGRLLSELDCVINDLVIEWVQQPMLRFTDFMLYQVVEIFYPSLLSFSKYYSKENLIKQALLDLNDDTFLKQNYTISNCVFCLPSTVEPSKKIIVKATQALVANARGHLNKTANISRLQYFPFEEVESDFWDIRLKTVELSLVNGKDSLNHPCLSHTIDLDINVHYITKLFELSFLYDIEEDLLCFDKSSLGMIGKFEEEGYNLKKKTSKSLAELRVESREFISKTHKKEKLMVDGRYHISITTPNLNLLVTNEMINIFSEISVTNLAFDDGMDDYLANTYISKTKVKLIQA